MNIDEFKSPGKKFRTCYRDVYHDIRDHDSLGLFTSIIDTFLASFAIGFHTNSRTPLGSNSINHTNMPYIDNDTQDLIILLMAERHPDLESADDLWNMVEEYAESGIVPLHDSIARTEWLLDISDLLGD